MEGISISEIPNRPSCLRHLHNTLVKDRLFLIFMCYELRVKLHLPAVIFEDNSAVVTVTTEENAYEKKRKHFFLMVINYVKEQINLGLIKIDRIAGMKNNADLFTGFGIRDKKNVPNTISVLGTLSQNRSSGTMSL